MAQNFVSARFDKVRDSAVKQCKGLGTSEKDRLSPFFAPVPPTTGQIIKSALFKFRQKILENFLLRLDKRLRVAIMSLSRPKGRGESGYDRGAAARSSSPITSAGRRGRGKGQPPKRLRGRSITPSAGLPENIRRTVTETWRAVMTVCGMCASGHDCVMTGFLSF